MEKIPGTNSSTIWEPIQYMKNKKNPGNQLVNNMGTNLVYEKKITGTNSSTIWEPFGI